MFMILFCTITSIIAIHIIYPLIIMTGFYIIESLILRYNNIIKLILKDLYRVNSQTYHVRAYFNLNKEINTYIDLDDRLLYILPHTRDILHSTNNYDLHSLIGFMKKFLKIRNEIHVKVAFFSHYWGVSYTHLMSNDPELVDIARYKEI